MRLSTLVLLPLLWGQALPVSCMPVNSITIAEQTVRALPNCLHYRIRGFCVWFSPWTGFTTTPYLQHYLPDVVVSVFPKSGANPWSEINATLDQLSAVAQQSLINVVSGEAAGSGQHSLSNQHEQHVFFKEVDVLGNPGLAILPKEILLPSAAQPLQPYFQSMLDSVLWRGFTRAAWIEEAAAMVMDVTYHVGSFPIDWGGIYPHQGFLSGTDDAIASVVIAFRAAHLITLDTAQRFGHLAQTLSTNCGQACSATTIDVNNDDTQFQRIYPVAENSCHIPGENLSSEVDSESNDSAYVWIIWRQYEGCPDGNGKFIQKVTF